MIGKLCPGIDSCDPVCWLVNLINEHLLTFEAVLL